METNYLPGKQTLSNESGVGWAKIRNGLRTEPVTFVFTTGSANSNSNIGNGKQKGLIDIITNS